MKEKFAIFGNPVAHSKSPQMQNAGFKYLNLDASYEKFHLENGDNIKEEFIKNSFSFLIKKPSLLFLGKLSCCFL